MYIVCWQNKENPEVGGHGSTVTLEVAQAWVADMNWRYPELRHWYEPATNEPKAVKEE